MYFYYDKLGQVAMYSLTPQGNTVLKEFKYSPTPDELSLMKQNYDLTIEGKKLVVKKPERLIVEQKKKDLKEAQNVLKVKINNKSVTLDDVADFISKLSVD
jgi:hypothetical protein